MPNVPYIGVTDFASHQQVLQAVECIPVSCKRRLHVGVMMSYKTLHGIPTQTGWEKIWPNGEGLRKIFQPHPNVFNVLHYADYSEPNLTKASDLVAAIQKAGPHVQGLQLDMVWPDPKMVKEVKQKFPRLEIILQVGKNALAQMEEREGFLGEEIKPYDDFTSYFLIDWSLGRGEPMHVPVVLDYVRDAHSTVSTDRIAIAGGLGPRTYEVLRNFFFYSKNLSCDMQGQARKSGKATDPIEMDRVCEYVRGVCSLLE